MLNATVLLWQSYASIAMAELRPTFELLSHLPAEDVMRHFGDWLRSGSCPVCGLSTEERIELYLPNERQHLWSPQLIVEMEAQGSSTRLKGRFGPHPYVWALVVAIAVILAFANLIALCVALAQLIMQQAPSAAMSVPVTAMLVLAWYGVARAGRGLGGDQVEELRRFFEATLATASADARENGAVG